VVHRQRERERMWWLWSWSSVVAVVVVVVVLVVVVVMVVEREEEETKRKVSPKRYSKCRSVPVSGFILGAHWQGAGPCRQYHPVKCYFIATTLNPISRSRGLGLGIHLCQKVKY
jgi:hypothetical protein